MVAPIQIVLWFGFDGGGESVGSPGGISEGKQGIAQIIMSGPKAGIEESCPPRVGFGIASRTERQVGRRQVRVNRRIRRSR